MRLFGVPKREARSAGFKETPRELSPFGQESEPVEAEPQLDSARSVGSGGELKP